MVTYPREISPNLGRSRSSSNNHGGLPRGALGHSAQNIGPQRVFQRFPGAETIRTAARGAASQPEETVPDTAQQPAPERAHRRPRADTLGVCTRQPLPTLQAHVQDVSAGGHVRSCASLCPLLRLQVRPG